MFTNNAPVNMVNTADKVFMGWDFPPRIESHRLLPPTTPSDGADDAWRGLTRWLFLSQPNSPFSPSHLLDLPSLPFPLPPLLARLSAPRTVNLFHLAGLTFALIVARRRWYLCQPFGCTERHLSLSHISGIIHDNTQDRCRVDLTAWSQVLRFRFRPLRKQVTYLPEDGVYCVAQETFPCFRRQEFGSEDGHEFVEIDLAVTWHK